MVAEAEQACLGLTWLQTLKTGLIHFSENQAYFKSLFTSVSLDPDQARNFVRPDHRSNCLTL